MPELHEFRKRKLRNRGKLSRTQHCFSELKDLRIWIEIARYISGKMKEKRHTLS